MAQSLKAIICRIGSEEYALDVNHVLSIERNQDIRTMPHTATYMAGIMNLRGSIIPVMDLSNWLGIHASGVDQDHKRIIVTEASDKKLGLIVDSATDVLDIDHSEVQAVEMQQGAQEVKQVANLDGRLILILDVPRLISQLDVSVFDGVETA